MTPIKWQTLISSTQIRGVFRVIDRQVLHDLWVSSRWSGVRECTTTAVKFVVLSEWWPRVLNSHSTMNELKRSSLHTSLWQNCVVKDVMRKRWCRVAGTGVFILYGFVTYSWHHTYTRRHTHIHTHRRKSMTSIAREPVRFARCLTAVVAC